MNTIITPNSIGIIFYKLDKKDNKIKILLYDKNSILEDIGGILIKNNEDNTAIYHLLNKTNFVIDLSLENKLNYNYFAYNKKYSHKILLIKADDDIINLTSTDFSKYEISGLNTLIKRTINWIDIDKFKIYFKNNLINPRIKLDYLLYIFNNISEELKNIEVMKQIKKCVFNA